MRKQANDVRRRRNSDSAGTSFSESKHETNMDDVYDDQLSESGDSTTLEDDEYEVEKIVKRKYDTIRKEHMYCVKWKGYEDKHNDWVPESDLGCPKLLEDFLGQIRQAPILDKPRRTKSRQTAYSDSSDSSSLNSFVVPDDYEDGDSESHSMDDFIVPDSKNGDYSDMIRKTPKQKKAIARNNSEGRKSNNTKQRKRHSLPSYSGKLKNNSKPVGRESNFSSGLSNSSSSLSKTRGTYKAKKSGPESRKNITPEKLRKQTISEKAVYKNSNVSSKKSSKIRRPTTSELKNEKRKRIIIDDDQQASSVSAEPDDEDSKCSGDENQFLNPNIHSTTNSNHMLCNKEIIPPSSNPMSIHQSKHSIISLSKESTPPTKLPKRNEERIENTEPLRPSMPKNVDYNDNNRNCDHQNSSGIIENTTLDEEERDDGAPEDSSNLIYKRLLDDNDNGLTRGWEIERVFAFKERESDGRSCAVIKFRGFKYPQEIPVDIFRKKCRNQFIAAYEELALNCYLSSKQGRC